MKKPLYILAAFPEEPSKLKHFFESGEGSVMALLQNPGSIRYGGWDFQTLDTPRIIRGECLEVRSGDALIINLYEDGTLISRAVADYTYLGWGRDEGPFLKNPRLNPVAIVELTYSFADFYAKLMQHFINRPKGIKFKLELKNAFIDKKRLYLTPYGVDTAAYKFDHEHDRHYAPANDMVKELICDANKVIKSANYVAYDLIEKLYLWFGLEPKEIPYVSQNEEEQRFVDIEKITKK